VLDTSFGDVGQRTAELRENPTLLQFLIRLPDEPQDEIVMINLYKEYDPFGAMVGGTVSFLFSAGAAAECRTGSKVCGYLVGDDLQSPTAVYDLGLGTLELRIADEPDPPASPVCRAKDGDGPGCSATAGCSYYGCAATCQPTGTDLCDAGCWLGCGVSGTLSGGMFYDTTQPACTSSVERLTF
jgi:hypothetical protein